MSTIADLEAWDPRTDDTQTDGLHILCITVTRPLVPYRKDSVIIGESLVVHRVCINVNFVRHFLAEYFRIVYFFIRLQRLRVSLLDRITAPYMSRLTTVGKLYT